MEHIDPKKKKASTSASTKNATFTSGKGNRSKDALDKNVKKAGGTKKYLAAQNKAKSNQVKVDNVYTTKGSARHKAYLKKQKKKK